MGRPRHRLIRLTGFAVLIGCLSPSKSPQAAENLSVLLTSNLRGAFSIDETDQDSLDPMLLLARSLVLDRAERKVDLHLDLGNSFLPGALSRYSCGAIVMGWFEAFSCDATLVSSMDMQVGIDALSSLQTGRRTKLLSANLCRDERPLFDPYMMVATAQGTSMAVLGVSSETIHFQIAEKELFNVRSDKLRGLDEILEEIEAKGADHILVLSGLSLKETIALLETHDRIGMAICGGDNTGDLFSSRALRIDMADGRPIIMLSRSGGYYRLDLTVDRGFAVRAIRWNPVDPSGRTGTAATLPRAEEQIYRDFCRRLSLWKREFLREEGSIVADAGENRHSVDDRILTRLMRDRYRAEIAVVDRNTINPSVLQGRIRYLDLSRAVNQDYMLLMYTLTGAQVEELLGRDKSLVFDGVTDRRVQGYPIEEKRRYRIVSTQSAMERMASLLGEDVPFENTWSSVNDLLLSDLRNEQVTFKEDSGYLERRFRATVDFRLSNFFNNAEVSKSDTIDPPPGRPSKDYRRWGLENRIDFTVYNDLHHLVVTPELIYERQGDRYLQNLVRGTLLYNLSINPWIRPYHKSQFETVLGEENDGFRPVSVRESIGAAITRDTLTMRLGVGMERKVNDPVEPWIYGVESFVDYRYPFRKYFTYTIHLDSFLAGQSVDGGKMYVRSDLENGISFSLNRFLSIGLKHRWNFLYSGMYGGSYSNSQFMTSLQMEKDFKAW